MAIIKKRVDDYLYNTKGEEARDARKVSISIPGLAFGGARAKKHDLDLSDKGQKAMEREREKLEEATRKLWAPFLSNVGFDPEKGAPKSGGEREDIDSADEESESPAESGTDEDLEAATSPSNFGSND